MKEILFGIMPFLVLLIPSAVGANSSDRHDLTADYLGLRPPGSEAVRFAPGIVADIHHEHSRLTLSKDGRELYWNIIPLNPDRDGTGRPFLAEKANIWFVRKTEHGWTKPAIFPLTEKASAMSPAFSADGNILYYQIVDPAAAAEVRPKPLILYGARRDGDNWARPVVMAHILPKEAKRASTSFCFAENGNLYFDYGGPMEDGQWWWEILFSEFRDGKYQKPVKLDGGINGDRVDWCPWIAPDESYLIWSSHREGGYGNGDLYISFRNRDGSWGRAVNMGKTINTEKQERFPSLSPDGKVLFFARHMPDSYSDIFWISAEVIRSLKTGQSSL